MLHKGKGNSCLFPTCGASMTYNKRGLRKTSSHLGSLLQRIWLTSVFAQTTSWSLMEASQADLNWLETLRDMTPQLALTIRSVKRAALMLKVVVLVVSQFWSNKMPKTK